MSLQHARSKQEGAGTSGMQAVPQGSWAHHTPALPSLCHRLCLLGRFQTCQDFIPLHKLLGEKQGLDMTLKESNVETAKKKPMSEHLDSTIAILIPWERPRAPGC